MIDARLDQLAYGWLDQALDAGDQAEFEERLLGSDDARQHYLRLAAFHGFALEAVRLKWGNFAASETASPSGDAVFAPSIQRASPTGDRPSAGPAERSPVLGFLSGALHQAGVRLSSPKVLAIGIMGILATYFVGLMISIALSRAYWSPRNSTNQPESLAGAPARIVASSSPRWQGGAPRADESGKLLAGMARLVEGVVELEFEGGARVSIEGPAEFAARNSQRIELVRGRLAAYVPRRARGFTVDTPSAQVIDLGTEFGVEVDDSAKTDVHVLKGDVKVNRAATDKNAREEIVRLSAGQAARFLGGQSMARIPLEDSRFRRVLQGIPNKLPAQSGRRTGLGAESSADDTSNRPTLAVAFEEDFGSHTSGPNLTLGPSYTAPAVSTSPTVDYSAGNFTITSLAGNRVYLGTPAADYSTVNFTFEATVVNTTSSDPWGLVFFGMGSGTPNAGNSGEPSSPNVLAGVRPDTDTFETRDNNVRSSFDNVATSVLGDRERLRMTWDATTRQAVFQLDTQYTGGPFTADYTLTVNGADNGFDATNSQLILGGGLGIAFDDVKVTIVAPRSSPIGDPTTTKQGSH